MTSQAARRSDSPKATRTVAYLRVSTDKQADHGISLDAQRAKVEAYASLYDLELVAVEVDAGHSAKSLDRPALQAAIARLRRGEADALLVAKLDRLTRSVVDLAELIELFQDEKRALLSVSEQIDTRSAAGRLILNILTIVGQWEREAIGERTKIAMQHLAAQGKYTGGKVPYGFTLGGDRETLVPNPTEQLVNTTARELHGKGMTLRAVAAELARLGMRSRAGKRFKASSIASMLAKAGT